jgi:hypothetical protein
MKPIGRSRVQPSLQSKSLPAMESDMADPARKYDPDPAVGQDPFNPAPAPIPGLGPDPVATDARRGDTIIDNRGVTRTGGNGLLIGAVIVVLAVVAFFIFGPDSNDTVGPVTEPATTEPAAPAPDAMAPAAPADTAAPAPNATAPAENTPAPAEPTPAPTEAAPAEPAPAPAPAQ